MKILPILNTNCKIYPIKKQSGVQNLNNTNKLYIKQINFGRKESYSITKSLVEALGGEDLGKIKKYMPSWLKSKELTINLPKGQRKGPLNFWDIIDGDKVIGKIDFFHENPTTKNVNGIRTIINKITNERFNFNKMMETGEISLQMQSKEVIKNGETCIESIYYDGKKISSIAYNHLNGQFICSVSGEDLEKINYKPEHPKSLFQLPIFEGFFNEFQKKVPYTKV